MIRSRSAALTLLVTVLSGCSDSSPQPPSAPFTLPADMPPMNCADFEPPPVPKPAETKFVGRRCIDPNGAVRWVHAFYQCEDGRIWPVLSDTQPTGANAPGEPTGPAFDQCLGR